MEAPKWRSKGSTTKKKEGKDGLVSGDKVVQHDQNSNLDGFTNTIDVYECLQHTIYNK